MKMEFPFHRNLSRNQPAWKIPPGKYSRGNHKLNKYPRTLLLFKHMCGPLLPFPVRGNGSSKQLPIPHLPHVSQSNSNDSSEYASFEMHNSLQMTFTLAFPNLVSYRFWLGWWELHSKTSQRAPDCKSCSTHSKGRNPLIFMKRIGTGEGQQPDGLPRQNVGDSRFPF